MPIAIKEYSWHETKTSVFITLPLNGVYKSKVDVFHTNKYLKVSFPPYFFEIFLPHKIWTNLDIADLNEDIIDSLCEDNGVKCLINDEKIFLELPKQQVQLWNNLFLDLDKDESKDQRSKAVEWRHKYEELLARKKLRAERARDRQAISDSIDQDAKYRNELQARKDKIKADFFKTETNSVENIENHDAQEAHEDNKKTTVLAASRKSKDGGCRDIESVTCPKTVRKSGFNIELASRIALENERLRDIPPPRNGQQANDGKVEIGSHPTRSSNVIVTTFTPKTTRAPLREDRDNEAKENDMEWKKKEHQHKSNVSKPKYQENDQEQEDTDPLENDCQHLLGKGEQFFKNGDFASALEVFSHGIQNVNSMFAAFHNNRGAVNLKVGNFHGAITDCSNALELLTPKCKSNEVQRAKAHLRIGTGKNANCYLHFIILC